MIIIKSLTLFGKTDKGDFESSISFNDNVNIISGENGFGKSTITTSIVWCLGLEQTEVISHDDNSFMPTSIRSEFELDDDSFAKIETSYVTLQLQNHSGEILNLTRPITDDKANKSLINCELNGQVFNLTSNKIKNFKDETSNLTRFIFKWADVDVVECANRKGGESFLYCENLANLHYINQQWGWSNLYSSKVGMYGILEVDECVFEHTLGLTQHFQNRQNELKGVIKNREQISIIKSVVDEVNSFIEEYNEEYKISIYRKNIEEIKDLYSEFSILDHLKLKGGFDITNEVKRLNKEIDDCLKSITKIEDSVDKDSIKEKSNELLGLKAKENELESSKQEVLLSIFSKEQTILEVDEKVSTSKHLLDFKEKKIGFHENDLDCPTCEQKISTLKYDFQNLSSNELEYTLKRYKNESSVLRKSLKLDNERLTSINKELAENQKKIVDVKREIEPYIKTLNNTEDRILDLVNFVSEKKVEAKKYSDKVILASDLSAKLKSAIKSASTSEVIDKEEDILKNERKVITKFKNYYREMLGKIKITVFQDNSDNSKKVGLNDSYLPCYSGQLLRNYCSASDLSRMILPYLLSAQRTALENNGNHFGVTIFDEPLQQNPDEKAKERSIDFFKDLRKDTRGQVLIFTSLTEKEKKELRSDDLKELKGKRFLGIGSKSF